MDIMVENMINPPDKMRLMFEAVSELIKEQKEISRITVAEITSKAGIGKGTAYEYFSSKEEIIVNALMYEYCIKIQRLAKSAFEPEQFKDRVYRIMDWLMDNREYNQMFTAVINSVMGVPGHDFFNGHSCSNEFVLAAKEYILKMIDKVMEYGYQKKAFTSESKWKRSMALMTAMVEYSFVITNQKPARYDEPEEICHEEVREFVYESLIKSLS